ncbi:MAG: hypothetical protein Q8Q88_21105 [Phenylobacterium sp.]|uniref:hypothetical protein n=1 Tax=Phenylobacterium sp. TaxID=1871053 RepID=UPI002735035F|nr:hypothetical protein [Phenylobacterium sp.]MDP3749540.1 hypothetical protein [Phenylobacterium sp.]
MTCTLGRLAASMTRALILAAALSAAGAGPGTAQTALPTLAPIPPKLEARYALSAAPTALRAAAAVYLLAPDEGYVLSREGTNGITCLVERTAWELVDFRDDIFIPLCYDAAGAGGHLKAIIDTARMRAEGLTPRQVRERVEAAYADGSYETPSRAGLSYMVSPVMRAAGPPDMSVQTMAMPHLMFYASGVSNADIAAAPDRADPATLVNPFIDRQGHDAQSYIIVITGAAEKARILADEAPLIADLCAYRDVLCLRHDGH